MQRKHITPDEKQLNGPMRDETHNLEAQHIAAYSSLISKIPYRLTIKGIPTALENIEYVPTAFESKPRL